jgi:hypothetical protein
MTKKITKTINPWSKASGSAGKTIKTPQGYYTDSPAYLRGAKHP